MNLLMNLGVYDNDSVDVRMVVAGCSHSEYIPMYHPFLLFEYHYHYLYVYAAAPHAFPVNNWDHPSLFQTYSRVLHHHMDIR